MEGQNKNKIEDLKRNLYDAKKNKINQAREGVIHPVEYDVEESWQEEKKEDKKNKKDRKPPLSIFKKFFILALVFFVGAMFYAGYNFFGNDKTIVSDEKIEINVVGNSFSKAGEKLPLEIEIINNNNANLELSYLSVEYPKGALNDWSNLERLQEIYWSYCPGESISYNFEVKKFREEKSVTKVRVGLEYHPKDQRCFNQRIYYPNFITAPLSLLRRT
jgi:hypothetical protein